MLVSLCACAAQEGWTRTGQSSGCVVSAGRPRRARSPQQVGVWWLCGVPTTCVACRLPRAPLPARAAATAAPSTNPEPPAARPPLPVLPAAAARWVCRPRTANVRPRGNEYHGVTHVMHVTTTRRCIRLSLLLEIGLCVKAFARDETVLNSGQREGLSDILLPTHPIWTHHILKFFPYWTDGILDRAKTGCFTYKTLP